MPIEIVVPPFGESITEGVISKWHKSEGDAIKHDENVVEIESDKATADVPSPSGGKIGKVLKNAGDKVLVGEVIGYVLTEAEAGGGEAKPAAPSTPGATAQAPSGASPSNVQVKSQGPNVAIGNVTTAPAAPAPSSAPFQMPAAQAALAQSGVNPAAVTATGPGGRMLKEDVQRAAESNTKPAPSAIAKPAPAGNGMTRVDASLPAALRGNRDERIETMTPIRQRIAQRLVEAQTTAAMLTTFNEIDMTDVMALRNKHKDAYLERYGVKLGFMSFFVKGAVDALKQFPVVNAEIREPQIVYKSYYDIGIAVGGGKGLVVPVLRNAELMSFAQIEKTIGDFGKRAAENKIKLDELQGGTFTISNGGVYGSLLSTPILNPPQSAILGLHSIQERPVARNGQVVIRPMMYVALTYDHRIVDGREAVTFLRRIKEGIEDPTRLLIEV
jgi:2-oxoglutarate dehydrogenase E2 component (dihydrolipoamide succinyltransferase)